MRDQYELHVLGVNFRTAPAAVREQLSFDNDSAEGFLRQAVSEFPGLELAILSTCNRVEFWVAQPAGLDWWHEVLLLVRRLRPNSPPLRKDCELYHHEQADALRHMCEVASGLDSNILGDLEILGQIKSSLAVAQAAGSVHYFLLHAMTETIRCGRRARRETEISSGQASVGSAVASMIKERSSSAETRPRVLVIGAAQIARSIAAHSAKHGAKVCVVNRTMPRAIQVATHCGGTFDKWENLASRVLNSDVVVAATGSQTPVITSELLSPQRSRQPLPWFIDAGVPRNIEPTLPAEITGIDAIHETRDGVLTQRESARPKVQAFVEETVSKWFEWIRKRPVEGILSSLYQELDPAIDKLVRRIEFGSPHELRTIIRASFRRFLHPHTKRLREFASQENTASVDAYQSRPLQDFSFPLQESEASSKSPFDGKPSSMLAHRIIYVDPGAVARKQISEALSREPSIEVIAAVPNGNIALKKIEQNSVTGIVFNPDLPDIPPRTFVEELKSRYPNLGVVILAARGSNPPTHVHQLGAEAIEYPSDANDKYWATEIAQALRRSVAANDNGRSASSSKQAQVIQPSPRRLEYDSPQILAIGCSTGGPRALERVLPTLPKDLPVPVVVVQHMPAEFTRRLVDQLDRSCSMDVVEGEHGMKLEPSTVYFAPGDFHMTVNKKGLSANLQLHQGPRVNSCRPAVDVLFDSIANTFGQSTLATVLTGMGADGLVGCKSIAAAGGRILVQDERTSVVWGMPGFVAKQGLANEVLPIDEIGSRILTIIGSRNLRTRKRKLAG